MATQTGSFDFKAAKLAKDSAEATASADATAKANQAEANAKKVATNFISADSAGIMVYDGESGQQQPSSPSANTSNVLIDSNGMYVRNGSTNLASFTASSAQIGQNSAAHSVVDTNGMRIYASDGSTQIANLGYGEGTAESGTATAPYYTLGTRSSSGAIGNYSVVEGGEVPKTSAQGGGWFPIIASGYCANAQNGGTQATGAYSHAEGCVTEANKHSAHAEGRYTVASGNFSHAQNDGAIARGEAQTALGKYNIADTTNAVIIGNGTADNARSNALTVDWNGNVNIASGAKYKINGNNLSASDVSAVPTTRTVNSKALSANITLSASDVGALANTGGQVSGDITLYKASGDSPSLIFQRGTLTDNYNDWRIYNTGGYLHFQQRGQNSTSWTDIAYIGSNGVIYGNGSGLSGIPAVGDTAWKTLTTDFNYVKRSGIVFVDFYKTNQSLSTSWTTIGTLPSGYRPNHNLYGAAMTLTTTPIAYFINSSSGVVQMRTATGSGSYVTAFSVSYPVL